MNAAGSLPGTLALACLLVSAPAAASGDPRGTQALDRVSDAVLAQQRGGFVWNGVDITFGAEINAYLDGRLMQRTTISWSDAVVETRETFTTSFDEAGADPANALPGAAGLTGNDSAVLLVNQGHTAFIQRSGGAIANIVINTASNVDLGQRIDATLGIRGYASIGAAARQDAALSGLRAATLSR